jgi:hypothetical protein
MGIGNVRSKIESLRWDDDRVEPNVQGNRGQNKAFTIADQALAKRCDCRRLEKHQLFPASRPAALKFLIPNVKPPIGNRPAV